MGSSAASKSALGKPGSSGETSVGKPTGSGRATGSVTSGRSELKASTGAGNTSGCAGSSGIDSTMGLGAEGSGGKESFVGLMLGSSTSTGFTSGSADSFCAALDSALGTISDKLEAVLMGVPSERQVASSPCLTPLE